MDFLLFSGSFDENSYTQALLKIVSESLSEHHCVAPLINELPFYSKDFAGSNRPKVVSNFLEQVEWAEAIIVCTPEHNHSIPAVLKNAIDWASRPAFDSPLKGKPVTFITQAISPVGGARAQAHLKLVFDSTLSRIHICHEMMIGNVDQKFNEQRLLIDEGTRERIVHHLEDFIRFVG